MTKSNSKRKRNKKNNQGRILKNTSKKKLYLEPTKEKKCNQREQILFTLTHFYKHYYNKPELKIIVSRFNESLDWLSPLNPNTLIYNKGTSLFLKNEKRLKNVGRESHTYLHYIVKNYHQLPEYVIFTQGNISDHVIGGYAFLMKIAEEAISFSQSRPKLVKNNQSGSWSPNFNLSMSEFKNYPYKDNRVIPFKEWFLENIYPRYPQELLIYKNAIFAVSKRRIHSRPLSYYQKLITFLDYHINPIEGHFMERSWYYIFSQSIRVPSKLVS